MVGGAILRKIKTEKKKKIGKSEIYLMGEKV